MCGRVLSFVSASECILRALCGCVRFVRADACVRACNGDKIGTRRLQLLATCNATANATRSLPRVLYTLHTREHTRKTINPADMMNEQDVSF